MLFVQLTNKIIINNEFKLEKIDKSLGLFLIAQDPKNRFSGRGKFMYDVGVGVFGVPKNMYTICIVTCRSFFYKNKENNDFLNGIPCTFQCFPIDFTLYKFPYIPTSRQSTNRYKICIRIQSEEDGRPMPGTI